jgi:hypothetical protein
VRTLRYGNVLEIWAVACRVRCRVVLVVAYIASAVLELVGLALVVWDVWSDRKGARTLLGQGRPAFTRGIRAQNIRGAKQAMELERLAERSARSEQELLDVIADMLRGGWRRVVGPVFIALGVVIGTAANIYAS